MYDLLSSPKFGQNQVYAARVGVLLKNVSIPKYDTIMAFVYWSGDDRVAFYIYHKDLKSQVTVGLI